MKHEASDDLSEERKKIIKKFYIELSETEQEAARRFDRYIDLLCRVAIRIASDPAALAEFQRFAKEIEGEKSDSR